MAHFSTVNLFGLAPPDVDVTELAHGGLCVAVGPVNIFLDRRADVVAVAWRLLGEADRLAGVVGADALVDAVIDAGHDRAAELLGLDGRPSCSASTGGSTRWVDLLGGPDDDEGPR